MAVAYITELVSGACDTANGRVNLAHEPGVALQHVSFSGTAGLSAAFNAATSMIRIMVTSSGHYQVGSAPVAVAGTDSPIPAAPFYLEMGVTPGHKISFVASDGTF